MENGTVKNWRFQGNKKLTGASGFTVRGVLNLLRGNLNENDPRPIIPLGHGDPSAFPCFRTATVVEDAIVDSVRSANYNHYAPTVGILPARRHPGHIDDGYLTLGCIQAIEVILTTLARPGANILLPRPGYPYYESLAAHIHLEVRHFDLLPEKGWEADLDSVEALADENTAAMLVINPGNPCGSVYTANICRRDSNKAWYYGNCVFGHLAFGSTPYVPMGVFGSIVPIVTLGSISKRWVVPVKTPIPLSSTYNNDPGVLIFMLCTCHIVDSIKCFLDISTDLVTFIQGALPQILEKTTEELYSKIIDILRKAADICYDKMKEIPCITCPNKPEGGMFVMVKLNVSLMEGINDDMDFAIQLAKEESVIVLPALITCSIAMLVSADVNEVIGVIQEIRPPSSPKDTRGDSDRQLHVGL
ncbi:hypothetical protein JRO89_XS01G0185100 [Xanthoceras sorbifolium]|uniref:Aminotransferase class I/classII large domain-containing protein n=1 Tax=Xanthoceras sorbifolium TaxID=99658 RepID=A0ABQ8IJY1_9ROSI|nr:hypothetical protein JRO89_XS01G0185100 [Xanthoceras sorbifolium]